MRNTKPGIIGPLRLGSLVVAAFVAACSSSAVLAVPYVFARAEVIIDDFHITPVGGPFSSTPFSPTDVGGSDTTSGIRRFTSSFPPTSIGLTPDAPHVFLTDSAPNPGSNSFSQSFFPDGFDVVRADGQIEAGSIFSATGAGGRDFNSVTLSSLLQPGDGSATDFQTLSGQARTSASVTGLRFRGVVTRRLEVITSEGVPPESNAVASHIFSLSVSGVPINIPELSPVLLQVLGTDMSDSFIQVSVPFDVTVSNASFQNNTLFFGLNQITNVNAFFFPVPEPSTLTILAGLGPLGLWRLRRRRRESALRVAGVIRPI